MFDLSITFGGGLGRCGADAPVGGVGGGGYIYREASGRQQCDCKPYDIQLTSSSARPKLTCVIAITQ